MKVVTLYVVAAVAFAVAALVLMTAGLLDRDISAAEERAIGAQYQELMGTLDRAERYYAYASRIPWVGADALNKVRARRAALQYWQGQYDVLVRNENDVAPGAPSDNGDLQFLIANAIYREGLSRVADRTSLMAALDAGVGAYRNVLQNVGRHADAAYNYEYVSKLRSSVEKGRLKTVPSPEPDDPHGKTGAGEDLADTSAFKVYVPLEAGERNKVDGGLAGKAPPIRKKG
jgi:hypothetical protein